MYKQRNDLLLERLKNKEKERAYYRDKLNERCDALMSKTQIEAIKKSVARTKSHI